MGSAGDTTTHSPNQSAFSSVLLPRSSRFLTTHCSQLVLRGELNRAWCLQRWEQPQEDGHDTLTISLGLEVRARVSERLLILYYVLGIVLGALPMLFPLILSSTFPVAQY